MYGVPQPVPVPVPVSKKIKFIQFNAGRSEDLDLTAPPLVTLSVRDNMYYADEDVGIEVTEAHEKAFVVMIRDLGSKNQYKIVFFVFDKLRFGVQRFIIPSNCWYCAYKSSYRSDTENYNWFFNARFFDEQPRNDTIGKFESVFSIDGLIGFTSVAEAFRCAPCIDVDKNLINFDFEGTD